MTVQSPTKLDLKLLDQMVGTGLVLRVFVDYDPPPMAVIGARLNDHAVEWGNMQVTIFAACSVLLGTDGEGRAGYVRYFREEPFSSPSAAVGITLGDLVGSHLAESYRNEWILDRWDQDVPMWLTPKEVVTCRRVNGTVVEIPAFNLIVMEHLVRLHQELATRVQFNDGDTHLLIGLWTQLGRFISDHRMKQLRKWYVSEA